jgi:hypothetical protein
MGEYIPVAPINDEARRRNGNLPGMGGVFNYVNLHVYHYAGNNPVKYTDPDGKTPQQEILDKINSERDPIIIAELGMSAYNSYGIIDPLGPLIGKYQQKILPGKLLEPLVKIFPWRFNVENAFKKIYADYIGSGHAFDKHVVRKKGFADFGISTKEQFVDFIEKIMDNPSDYKKLENSRDAFWDDATGTVVVRDFNHPDKGTAFRPKDGKSYFDNDLH